MTRIVRFLRLAPADRALLMRAGILIIVVGLRLRMRAWPASVRPLSGRPWSLLALPRSLDGQARRVVWAVRTSAGMIPGATCLTQALALQWLLASAGVRCQVQIGVAKDAFGAFQAHAWVENEGRALLDRPDDVARYSPLIALEAASMPRPASRVA